MRLFGLALSLGLSLCAAAPAVAQNFPNKPGQIIVPFAAGGGTDVMARALAVLLIGGAAEAASRVLGVNANASGTPWVSVRAEVVQMDQFSAHADASEILAWMRGFERPPRQTFVTHGEPTAADAMRARIEHDLGWPARVPDYLQTVDLT